MRGGFTTVIDGVNGLFGGSDSSADDGPAVGSVAASRDDAGLWVSTWTGAPSDLLGFRAGKRGNANDIAKVSSSFLWRAGPGDAESFVPHRAASEAKARSRCTTGFLDNLVSSESNEAPPTVDFGAVKSGIAARPASVSGHVIPRGQFRSVSFLDAGPQEARRSGYPGAHSAVRNPEAFTSEVKSSQRPRSTAFLLRFYSHVDKAAATSTFADGEDDDSAFAADQALTLGTG